MLLENVDSETFTDVYYAYEKILSYGSKLAVIIKQTQDVLLVTYEDDSKYLKNIVILQIVRILTAYYKENGVIEKKFNTFNIDLHNGELLEAQDVLDSFMLDEKSIETSLFNQLQAKGLGVCDDKQENCYADDLSAADLVYYIDEKKIFIL